MAEPGRTLVVGNRIYETSSDRRLLYRKAVGLDMIAGPGVDIVHDLEQPLSEEHGKFNHVDLVSVLEHCKRPWKVAANIEKLMVRDATLLICVPFVWRVHDYPGDYWRMTPAALEVIFPRIGWVERGFMVAGKTTKLVRGLNEDDSIYMERAETIAFGRKCASTS
jgi:hypothetical protein